MRLEGDWIGGKQFSMINKRGRIGRFTIRYIQQFLSDSNLALHVGDEPLAMSVVRPATRLLRFVFCTSDAHNFPSIYESTSSDPKNENVYTGLREAGQGKGDPAVASCHLKTGMDATNYTKVLRADEPETNRRNRTVAIVMDGMKQFEAETIIILSTVIGQQKFFEKNQPVNEFTSEVSFTPYVLFAELQTTLHHRFQKSINISENSGQQFKRNFFQYELGD